MVREHNQSSICSRYNSYRCFIFLTLKWARADIYIKIRKVYSRFQAIDWKYHIYEQTLNFRNVWNVFRLRWLSWTLAVKICQSVMVPAAIVNLWLQFSTDDMIILAKASPVNHQKVLFMLKWAKKKNLAMIFWITQISAFGLLVAISRKRLENSQSIS